MSWSSSRSSRDNWERLVQAVLKKELIWQLCHQDSITTIASDFSQGILSLRPDSSSQLPLTDDSVVEDRKHASGTITQKLFSASVWRRKPKDYYLGQGLAPIPEANFRNFSLRELLAATGNFSEKHVLGRGGHGTVYKGLLADGTRVAVKRLKQQVIGIELEMASHVSHRNVIALCGFCITPKEQLLVYPIMENQSVASCLRERPKTQSPLKWPLRKQIALRAARGLSYLHHDCMRRIIHRDVKAANILLDINFDAIIADFTLAKFVDCYDYDGVKGTIDHIAPEYLTTGKCSVKSDVYGYGQFLLELITGQKIHLLRQLANNDNMMIHDWVNILWKDKNMVDPDLEGNFIEDEVQKLLLIALICTRHDPGERPMMFEVVRMLEDRAGDGVAERWEEFLINKSREKLIPHDNVEWIVCWSDDGVPDELSGPR